MKTFAIIALRLGKFAIRATLVFAEVWRAALRGTTVTKWGTTSRFWGFLPMESDFIYLDRRERYIAGERQ